MTATVIISTSSVFLVNILESGTKLNDFLPVCISLFEYTTVKYFSKMTFTILLNKSNLVSHKNIYTLEYFKFTCQLYKRWNTIWGFHLKSTIRSLSIEFSFVPRNNTYLTRISLIKYVMCAW